MVRLAVQTELAADRDDHSHWQYRDLDRKPEGEATYEVVETGHGAVKKKLQANGQPLTRQQLLEEDLRIQTFIHNQDLLAKQRKDGEQDDKRAEVMLRMLPDAFLWSVKSEDNEAVTLAFTPDPKFDAPNMEARVFAAMAGEMVVSKPQNRIQSLRGKLIRDVKFGFGLLGRLDAGGTFNVERRELAPAIWQITESHVHINGRALLFKNIGQQEDEVKSDFRQMPDATTLEQAATLLKAEPPLFSAQSAR